MKTISSKRNVFEEYCAILSDFKRLLIIAPFIKVNSLETILGNYGFEKVTVVTSWKVLNFARGVSDVDIYIYSERKNITLLANNRIHLKVITNEDFAPIIITSANITDSAMGIADDYNYEYGAVLDSISIEDKLYLDTIIHDSIPVTEEIYKETLKKIEISRFDKHIEEIKLNKNSFRVFSLQDLPAINSPERFIELLNSPTIIKNELEMRNFEHDKQLFGLYNIEPDNLFASLKNSYFTNALIKAFLQFNDSGKHFGELTSWLHNICTDIPVPKRVTIKEYVRRLFDYTVYLSEGCYKISVPGAHSEQLVRIKECDDE